MQQGVFNRAINSCYYRQDIPSFLLYCRFEIY